MKILVADDNPVFRTVLHTMLTSWGHEVVLACDGREAWQLLSEEGGPRLAILDWMMPQMDGIEVCRRVRRANPGHYVYILMLTARTQSQDLLEAMEAGADDYVTKPLKSQELRSRLHTACRILELEEQLARRSSWDGVAQAAEAQPALRVVPRR